MLSESYLLPIVFGCLRLVLELHTLFVEVIAFEVLSQILITADGHHLKLSVAPRVKSQRAHLGDMDAQTTVQT